MPAACAYSFSRNSAISSRRKISTSPVPQKRIYFGRIGRRHDSCCRSRSKSVRQQMLHGGIVTLMRRVTLGVLLAHGAYVRATKPASISSIICPPLEFIKRSAGVSCGVALIAAAPSRLAYIDWMRGLACVLMFQTHCYDAWLSPAARQSKFFMYSQLGGTFPAPLFLFLAGVSFALVTEKLWQKNLAPAKIARATIRRGAEIFAFGLLFRLQEYVIAWGWAPLSDLLRVDVLNTIGLSMMLMGVMCWLVLAVHRGAHTRVALVLAS